MNAIAIRCRPKRAAAHGALARLPVFFALDGKRAVVAGGSAAAAWKASCFRPQARRSTSMRPILARSWPRLQTTRRAARSAFRRNWTADDLADAALAVGAFDDDLRPRDFAAAARDAGVPVNVIDKPAFCDFSFGSIVNRSPLVVGISTDGAAPVFAQAIRAKIEALLPQGFARWVAAAVQWRPR